MIKKQLIFSVLLSFVIGAKAQTVSLFAGSAHETNPDWYAYSGATAGINQTSDSFEYPWGLCVDTTGKFWISEYTKMLALVGGKSYVKGGFTGNPLLPGAQDYVNATGTNSRFNQPRGLALHPVSNEVYICDYGNNVIRKGTKYYSGLSVWTLFAGVQVFIPASNFNHKDGALTSAKFYGPEDIVSSSDGNTFYVSDQYNHCIRKINGGQVTTIAGDTVSGDLNATGKSARFSFPCGLFLENDNSLLVCDRNNNKIKRVNLTTGAVSTVVSGLGSQPSDVVVISGILYIAGGNCIRTWDGSKLKLYAGKHQVEGYVNGNDSIARFRELAHLTYDVKTKSIYVADLGNNVFRKIPVIALPIADFWANKTTPFVNDVVVLHSNSTNTQVFAWTISPGTYVLENGSKLTDSVVQVSFSNTGSYSVTLKVTNAAGSDTKIKNNYINVSTLGSAKPIADFTASKTVATVSDTITMIESSTQGPTSWAWKFTPSTITYLSGTTSTTRFPKVKFTNAGLYTIELTATNANGNNIKTRTNYVNISATAVRNLTLVPVSIYPNPAQNLIYVGSIPKDVVSVIGVDGKIFSIKGNGNSLDIKDLASGIYMLRFESADGRQMVGKFVKLSD